MPTGKSCIICKHTTTTDPTVHMHRTPKVVPLRQQWLKALGIEETDLPKDPRVCSCHFSDGDATKLLSLTLGKKFTSPKNDLLLFIYHCHLQRSAVTSSISITSKSHTVLSTDTSELPSTSSSIDDAYITVNAALMAKIEMLESENAALKQKDKAPFRLEDVMHNDSLVKMYTGFPSYELLVAFFDFLGPAVNNLNYWGAKGGIHGRQKKLNPFNCLFLTLMKLRLNLTEGRSCFSFWHFCSNCQ